jgi:hypothetical protein
MEKPYLLIETGQAFPSELFPIARHLVRLSEELPKPSNQRLREYRDSNLDSLKLQLFSPAPLAPALERVKLATGLTFLAENLGGGHSTVATVLNGRNPAARAEELIAGCTLFDPAERRKLFDGGAAAIQASKDPMILLARSVDGLARTLRKEFDEKVEEPERKGFADLAKLRFAAYGKNIAPDATFSLRLAYGQVKGYAVDGANLPFHTTVRGAFERSESMQNREPFDLPASWLNAKSRLDPATPFNFVSTADTIGGNSGSPVLNRAGELIGVNFDRNRHGLVRNFVYTDVQARHVAVHSRIVLAALEHVYDAKELLGELTGR